MKTHWKNPAVCLQLLLVRALLLGTQATVKAHQLCISCEYGYQYHHYEYKHHYSH